MTKAPRRRGHRGRLDDVKNYTSITPVQQISEVVDS